VNIVFYLSINQVKNKWIDSIAQSNLNKLEVHYKTLLYQQEKLADATFMETMEIDGVKDILTQANEQQPSKRLDQLRNNLKNTLDKKYKLLRMQGVLQYHFVFPNNQVFLRMHKPSKYNDDLSDIRKDFAYVNKTKKIIRGFQQGRTAHGFRNIYPLYNDNKEHIGALEISFSSELFQEYLTKINKLHTHFLVDKKIFSTKTWEREGMVLKYLTSSENDDYMMTMTNNHHKNQCITYNTKRLQPYKMHIKQHMNQKEKFTQSIVDIKTNKDMIISFYPIHDSITDEVTAWIISYEKVAFITYLNYSAFILNAVLFILSALFLYFLYHVSHQKEILNLEVANKTKELNQLNQNLEKKVEKEVEKNLLKERQLLEQSKSAELGTMIGNIAHQWKQPLNYISVNASGIKFESELGILKNSSLSTRMDGIIDKVTYMSETITTFRNFLKDKKELKTVTLQNTVDIAVNITSAVLKDRDIQLINNIDYNNPVSILLVTGELEQVLINIINNASDALKENHIEKPWIKIDLYSDEETGTITIEDNAGGIPEDILPKVFDEYFSTKAEDVGTGLGLYMSKRIINESLRGEISARNTQNGAKFVIILPLNR
jgi:two-component system C4-dicarboxylate transport sensor histidine kinase DctB